MFGLNIHLLTLWGRQKFSQECAEAQYKYARSTKHDELAKLRMLKIINKQSWKMVHECWL